MKRDVSVSLFGKLLTIGSVPKQSITDLLTITEFYRRGKQPRLDSQRLQAIDEVLADTDGDIHSLLDLRSTVESMRSEKEAASFDAETYYTAERVSEYSSEFIVPQDRHTRRCVYLLNASSRTNIVLDLGCGSGLSSKVLQSSFGFVIGLDLSSAMLAQFDPRVGDCILGSMAQPLPFRGKVFDACSSTSAVHYLLNKPSELSTLLTSLDRTVSGDCAFQLFPRGGLPELAQIQAVSPFSGFLVVGDKPHRKDSRWYVLLSRTAELPGECMLFPGASCLQRLDHDRGCIDGEYWDWLEREHVRFTRRQIRIGLPSQPHC